MPKFLDVTDKAAARSALGVERVFDVTSYGAVGDGVADDRAAIHAARDAAGVGGTVYFPPGTYRVEMVGASAPGYKFMSGGLQANVAGQTWLLGSAELVLIGTERENLITVMAQNVSIIGGTLDLSEVPGAYYHNAAIGVFSGTIATGVVYGDHGTNAAGAVIRDVTINNASAIGVWVQMTNSVTVTGCTITNFYQTAIGVQADVTAADLHDIVLHGNRIESDAVMRNSGIGVGANDQLTAAFVAGTNVVIKRVRITDNNIVLPREFRVGGTPSPIDTGCIEMFNVEDAIVDGNITDGSAFGITTGFLRNVVYSDNTCKGFRRIGLEIGGGLDGVNVVGNLLDSDGAAGPFNGTTGAQDPAGSERQVTFGILGAGLGYWRNLTIANNTITGFTTAARTGALSIANDQGGATLENVVISGNSITADGGSALFTAIGLGAPSTNVTITGNTMDGSSRTPTTGIGVVNNTHTGLSITGNSFSNFDKVTDLPGTLTDVRFTGNLVRNCATIISGSGVAGATRMLVDGITGVTSTAQIELGHASDTTLARSSAGVVSVEGVPLVTTTGTATLSGKSLSSPNIDGGAGTAFINTTSLAASANLYVSSKNLGSVRLAGGGVSEVLWAVPITSGVNYMKVNASVAGSAPSLEAAGTDAAISLNLRSVGAGAVLANGVPVSTNSTTATHTAQQIELGHATDTTIARSAAGVAAVEGNPVSVRVTVPGTSTTAGKPGYWAADASYIYTYTGDGTTHTWVRATAATW